MKSKRVIFIIAVMIISSFILLLFAKSFRHKQVLEVEKFYIYEGTSLSTKADTSISELNKYQRKEFSDVSSLALINSFKEGKNYMYLWKGYWHGVIILKDKSMHIIRISRYGGFFWDMKLKKIFEIEPASKKDEWQNLINPFINI